MQKNRKNTGVKSSIIILLVFALGFSVFAVLIPVVVVDTLFAYNSALSFSITTGKVIESSIQKSRYSSKQRYSANVVFEYAVNGRTYQSDNIHFNRTANSATTIAEKTIAKYPVGSTVTVYYDPMNPQNAILEPRIEGRDLMWLVLWVPIILGVIFVWHSLIKLIWFIITKPPNGGFAVSGRPDYLAPGVKQDSIRIRVEECLPLGGAAGGSGIIGIPGFAATMIITSLAGWALPLWLALTLLAAVLLAATLMWLVCARSLKSGIRDLHLDYKNQILTLPRYGKKSTIHRIPFSAIQDIVYDPSARRAVVPKLHPDFEVSKTTEEEGDLTIVEVHIVAARAQALADWLRNELGLTPNQET